jgi:hypothetical protein
MAFPMSATNLVRLSKVGGGAGITGGNPPPPGAPPPLPPAGGFPDILLSELGSLISSSESGACGPQVVLSNSSLCSADESAQLTI